MVFEKLNLWIIIISGVVEPRGLTYKSEILREENKMNT